MVSEQIKNILPKIRGYLSTQPIQRAWIFGSCSRGEERSDSDIDLIVVYDHSQRISLLKVCHIINELEDITGRRVDMVEDGYLMPFAQFSANRDRLLIFDRQSHIVKP